jgi:hypothetical protein
MRTKKFSAPTMDEESILYSTLRYRAVICTCQCQFVNSAEVSTVYAENYGKFNLEDISCLLLGGRGF